ncbi:hypothetical protein AURDEDRAFT_182549 [Auricularia subglabra TFB-10046 SS5]|nr:hypothetical protein AURDEDRAFT_182549 [Auricularia subglabra TFB-10046 SS5]
MSAEPASPPPVASSSRSAPPSPPPPPPRPSPGPSRPRIPTPSHSPTLSGADEPLQPSDDDDEPVALPQPPPTAAADGEVITFMLDESSEVAASPSAGGTQGIMNTTTPRRPGTVEAHSFKEYKPERLKAKRETTAAPNSRRKEHTYWMCGFTDGFEYKLVCGQLFNHQSNVYHHINKIHKEYADVGRLVSMLDLRITDTYKCPGCRREFGREDSCRQHQRAANHQRAWAAPVRIDPSQRGHDGSQSKITTKWLCAFRGIGPEEDHSAPECNELVMQPLGHLRAAHGVRHASNSYGRYVDMRVQESFRCAHCPCEFISREATLHHAQTHAKEGLDQEKEPTTIPRVRPDSPGEGSSKNGGGGNSNSGGMAMPSHLPYPDYDWQTIPPTRWPCILRQREMLKPYVLSPLSPGALEGGRGWPRLRDSYMPPPTPVLDISDKDGEVAPTTPPPIPRQIMVPVPPPPMQNLPPPVHHPAPRHAAVPPNYMHMLLTPGAPPVLPPHALHHPHHPHAPPHVNVAYPPLKRPPGRPPGSGKTQRAAAVLAASAVSARTQAQETLLPPYVPPPGMVMAPPHGAMMHPPGMPPLPPGAMLHPPGMPPPPHGAMMPPPGMPPHPYAPPRPRASRSGSASANGHQPPPPPPSQRPANGEAFVPALPAAIPPVGMLIDDAATDAPAASAKGKERAIPEDVDMIDVDADEDTDADADGDSDPDADGDAESEEDEAAASVMQPSSPVKPPAAAGVGEDVQMGDEDADADADADADGDDYESEDAGPGPG